MPSRPTSNPRWSTSGTNTDPGSAARAAGYSPEDRPPAAWHNYKFNSHGEWIRHLQEGPARNIAQNLRHEGTDDNDIIHAAASNPAGILVLVGTPDARAVFRFTRGGEMTEPTNSGASGFVDVIWSTWAALFVAVRGPGLANGESSPDGVTWTARTMNSETYNSLDDNGTNLLVAVGPTGNVVTSANGTTWTDRTMAATAEDQNGVAYGTGLWVSVGTNGDIHTSPDGITWTARTSGTAEDLNGVVYDSVNGLWVVVGDEGVILTNPNGTTWTARTSGVDEDLRSVAHDGNGVILAGGTNDAATYQGVLLISRDATTWEILYDPSDGGANATQIGGVYDLHWSSSRGEWVMCGQSGDGVTQVSYIRTGPRA